MLVCENHPDKAWPDECDCGPGMESYEPVGPREDLAEVLSRCEPDWFSQLNPSLYVEVCREAAEFYRRLARSQTGDKYAAVAQAVAFRKKRFRARLGLPWHKYDVANG